MAINIELILDDSLLFNYEIIEEMRKHALVFNIDEKTLSYLEEQLLQGNELTLKQNDDMEVYKIDSNGKQVGIFLLKKLWDPEAKEVWESITLVFEQYRKQGISKIVRSSILKMHPHRSFSPVIHKNNPAIEGLERDFKKLGFEFLGEDNNYRSWIYNKST